MDTLEQYEEQVNSIGMYSGSSVVERMLSSGLLAIAQELRGLREDRQRQHRQLTSLLADVVLAPQEDLIELRKRIEFLENEYGISEQ